MLKGKTVVLGVTGSIAAYKIASLASMLIKQHADVHVIMTQNATNFIHPTAFETLTRHKQVLLLIIFVKIVLIKILFGKQILNMVI